MIINRLSNELQLRKLKKAWRSANAHNATELANTGYTPDYEECITSGRVSVGRGTYGPLVFSTFGNPEELLSIGNYCSIAGEVLFMLGGNHSYRNLSTYPFRVMNTDVNCESYSNGPIRIDDDVWVGQRATIMSGVHIGQGAVIAAGAVVTKDVPPYAIVGGVPTELIRYRFSEPVIEFLLTLDYASLTEDLIKAHLDELYTDLERLSVAEVKEAYAWFPKKA